MLVAPFLISLIALGETSTMADDGTPADRSQEMAAKIRVMAAGLGQSPLSNFFSVISRQGAGISTKLTAAQVELAVRLDVLGRDVTRAWLVSGLDKEPLPLEAELADRLGRRGDEVRGR